MYRDLPVAAIEAVSFDFYNTLVHHRAGRGRGPMLMEYLREQGLESNPWEHQVLYDVFERHGEEYAPDLPAREREDYYRRLAERLFRRLGVRAPPGAAAERAARIWELLGPASLAVYPEVGEVLRSLRGAGLRLAVVSNWQCGLEHFCTEIGFRDRVDEVVASAEVGSAKPDAAIFVEACRRLGVPPSRVLHVGDSAVDDLEGARAAGLASLLLRRDDASPGDRTLRGLGELPALLGLEGDPRRR
jgi:HAD superfamily hydrolase (TIGR01509 family)